MEAIAWSSNLHSAVKQFKELDLSKVGSVPNVNAIMNSFSLSLNEKKVIAKQFLRINKKASPLLYWH